MHPGMEKREKGAIIEEQSSLSSLYRQDILSCLAEGIYRIPFSDSNGGNQIFAVSTKQRGRDKVLVELENGLTFVISIKEL